MTHYWVFCLFVIDAFERWSSGPSSRYQGAPNRLAAYAAKALLLGLDGMAINVHMTPICPRVLGAGRTHNVTENHVQRQLQSKACAVVGGIGRLILA